MQANQTPKRLPLAFATNGVRNDIPEASQATVTPGAALLNDGFPPSTMQARASGGIPPAGKDFNGILFLLSAAVRWMQADGGFGYDAAFAKDSNVGGYPQGAVLLRADGQGFWFNTADNNATNPDATENSARNWLSLNADWNATTGPAAILHKPDIPAALGFTPVQQGGGINQYSNKIYIGWRPDGSGLGVTVDNTDLGNVLFGSGVPVGTGMPFFGGAIPAGFLLANGAAVSRSAFAALFGVIGGNYGGGDGWSTFNLPDTRGVVLRGLDNGRGLDPGRALGTYQGDAFGWHDHSVSDPGHGHGVSDPGHAHALNDPGHEHTMPSSPGVGQGAQGANSVQQASGSTHTSIAATGVTLNASATSIGIYGASTNISIQGVGDAETRMKNLSAYYIIKY